MDTISRYLNLVWATERVKERIGLELEDNTKNTIIQELLQDTAGSTIASETEWVYRPYLVAGLMLIQDVGRNTIKKSGEDEFKEFAPLVLNLYKYQHSIDLKLQTVLTDSLDIATYIAALSLDNEVAKADIVKPKNRVLVVYSPSLMNNTVF